MDIDFRDRQVTPTVSRVMGDTIIELVFDRETSATGLLVARPGSPWRIEQRLDAGAGETLIPYSARNNLIAHNCVLLPSKPEPFLTKEKLLADIRSFLHKYVDLSPAFEQIAAHYVLLSWVYDAFAEIPYLRLQGEYGTGKTRGLIAIGSLCYKPFFAAGASTVSPIFHTLDRFAGTLVLDEADFRFSDATADLVKIFNNGTVKGLPVLRTVQNRNKEFNPAAFHVFGPKIIAMRGSFEDEALESRFLTEETGLRPLRADISLSLPDSLHEEALVLRIRLLQFRLSSLFTAKPNPALSAPGLDPRLNQISLPLLSLIDDPALREEIQARLSDLQTQSRAKKSQTEEAQVLKAAIGALSSAAGGKVSVQSIADVLNRGRQTGYALSARRVGSILKSRFRIETRKSHGSYIVAAADQPKLEALAVRYGLTP